MILLGTGVLVLLIAWLPMVLKKRPLSLAIVCVLIGAGVFWSGAFDFRPDPIRSSTITKRTRELVVIVALMGPVWLIPWISRPGPTLFNSPHC